MADATTNITPDSFNRGSSNGHVADLAALGAITTSKDIAAQLVVMASRQNDDFNALSVATVTARAEVTNAIAESRLQAERHASAAVLLATQLAATAAAAAAACCCELKEKIGEDGAETRELMNEIERRHCERRETDLKIDLSNTRQTLSFEHILDERLERFGSRSGGGHS